MKKKAITGLMFLIIGVSGYAQIHNEDNIPLAPEQNRRPENFQPESYKYSLEELKDNFSVDVINLAALRNEQVGDVNNKGKWKPTPESIDNHKAPEWFTDAKFGMFIDWGLWSVAGYSPQWEGKAMYPDWYEYRMDKLPEFIKYHEKNWGKDFKRDDFIPLFKAEEYHPEHLVEIAKEAGMKYVIPFCKHHGGYCLWPSSFTHRDAVDMGPKKDLIKPLVESCQQKGLKFGFYFSIEEWEYPLIDNDGNIQIRKWAEDPEPYSYPYTAEFEKKLSGKIPVKNYTTDYLIPQATEFIDLYDPDILWYDGDWKTSAKDLQTYEIAAYFYNKTEGRKKVAVNDRYGWDEEDNSLRGVRGDYFTSEYKYGRDGFRYEEAIHPWEECRGISQSFGYNWEDTDENVISSKAFIGMFIDIVARGGNLLLVVNLDGQGTLPEVQKKRLKDIGEWLKVNGEGIYETRPYSTVSEVDVRYTQSKNSKIVYAITKVWPGKEMELKSVIPKSDSDIYLLGAEKPLKWSYDPIKKLTTILIPDNLQKELNRPCKYAYTFRIEI